MTVNSRSGVMGVSLHAQTGKWVARIMVEGKTKYLGIFENLEDAAKARREGDLKYGFHENHGRE